MTAFVYCCPVTGSNVQAHAADPTPDNDSATYHAVTCMACARVHLVNPKTARVAGVERR